MEVCYTHKPAHLYLLMYSIHVFQRAVGEQTWHLHCEGVMNELGALKCCGGAGSEGAFPVHTLCTFISVADKKRCFVLTFLSWCPLSSHERWRQDVLNEDQTQWADDDTLLALWGGEGFTLSACTVLMCLLMDKPLCVWAQLQYLWCSQN